MDLVTSYDLIYKVVGGTKYEKKVGKGLRTSGTDAFHNVSTGSSLPFFPGISYVLWNTSGLHDFIYRAFHGYSILLFGQIGSLDNGGTCSL